jgi:hypothetical protein
MVCHFNLGIEPLSMAVDLLQLCIYPRIKMAPIDALFTSEFIFLLQKLNIQNFSVLSILDTVTYVLTQIFETSCFHANIISMTYSESTNFGLFLGRILETVTEWFRNESKYLEILSHEYHGFLTSWPKGDLLDHPDYCLIFRKWHFNMETVHFFYLVFP